MYIENWVNPSIERYVNKPNNFCERGEKKGDSASFKNCVFVCVCLCVYDCVCLSLGV